MSQPYTVTTLVLSAKVVADIRGDTRYVSLIAASVDPATVEVSIGPGDSWQPLFLGVIPSEFAPGINRIAVRSTTSQTVKIGTGSAMIYDTRTAPGGTASMSITDVGGAGLGQDVMAGSLPVVIASDQSAIPISGTVTSSGTATATGPAANGAAVSGNPVRIAGSDGTLTRDIATDTAGRLVAVGAAATGAAVAGAPVRIGGSDGTNTRDIKTDTSGNQICVGAVADGSAVGTTAPCMMAGSDGTNVKRIACVADNVATPSAGNQTAIAGLYSSSARALTSARVAFLSVDRGGKVLTTPCGTLDPALAGYTATVLDAAASTNAAYIKASAGMVYEVSAFNAAAYDVYLRLYNKASAPTVGTDVAYRVIRVPAGSSVVVTYPGGAYFSTGIAYATTKLAAYNDATALAAHDLQFTIQTA